MCSPETLTRGLAALLLTLLLAPQAAGQGSGVVRGRVSSESTGAPLAAVVEVVNAGRTLTAVADRAGGYRLRGIPAGRRLIRASHLGYAPLEVEVVVPAGGEVVLEMALTLAPVQLSPVEVEAGRAERRGDTLSARAPELALASARALESTPGLAELGLTDAARGVPGQEPVDPSDVLYVRGAAADLKLVYLDGAPVYAPFPLGGLLEAFTPQLLRSADVYLGGAPARYDGGLSYVLDLRTRGVRTDRAHSSGSLDLLTARVLAEAPLGRSAGLLVGGRAVHGLGSADPLPYGYAEALTRVDAAVGSDGLLSFTGFRNAEEVWLEAGEVRDSTVRWGNSALSLRYRGRLRGTDAELGAALGDFEARLPLDGRTPMVAEGSTRRLRLSADLAGRAHGALVRYGLAYDRQEQSYRARLAGGGAERTPHEARASADVVGAYVDVGWQPAPRLRLRGGLRADRFSLGPELVLAPRASATWLITERAALTLAAGRYHQYLRAPEAALLAPATGAPRAPVAPLAVGRATHLALALDQQLSEELRLGVEGFYKSYHGIPGTRADEASASGMDVWVGRSEGPWTGWLGYSLAWVWSLPGSTTAGEFAGRHLLSTGVEAALGERTRIDVRFAYGAGLPYSAIPIAATARDGFSELGSRRTTPSVLTGDADAPPLLPTPDRPYLRLDLGASRTWTGRWWGSPVEVASYLKLLNTLGRRDALFYRFQRGRDSSPRALAALPLVPVLGVEWKF